LDNQFTVEETSEKPSVSIPEGHTLVMYDPNAVKPSWIHWIATSQGDVLPYKGPSPPPGTGIHHYIFALLPGKVPSQLTTNQNRGGKNVSDLVKSAVATTYFTVNSS
jgi:phosphatidylethanolamine-binding protein (PEBP) family uncharacterized protein